VDHAAYYVHVEHQVGFSAVQRIRAKQGFERLCMDNGVVVQDYSMDSKAFKANSFVAYINSPTRMVWLSDRYKRSATWREP
jgi:hypothetical protein